MRYEYWSVINTYLDVDYRHLEPMADIIDQKGREGFKLVKFDIVRGVKEFTIIVMMERAITKTVSGQ